MLVQLWFLAKLSAPEARVPGAFPFEGTPASSLSSPTSLVWTFRLLPSLRAAVIIQVSSLSAFFHCLGLSIYFYVGEKIYLPQRQIIGP